MFELEEYSSGFHDGFLSKYADTSGPTLDFCISDSLQDILDIDIRSEIANVVGGKNTEISSLVNELPSSLDHAIEALTAINNNNIMNSNNVPPTSSSLGLGGHSSNSYSSFMSSPWFGMHSSSSWSSSNDYFADVGACVDPNSVMPLISTSMIHQSPKLNLNANAHRRHASSPPPPPSPNVHETKSHLTFSPAQVKVSANALRNEHITSHIPKQIVAISSSVTAATTAPATMATNSMLQRKQANSAANASVDAVKKDLAAELRKASAALSAAGSPQPTSSRGKDDSVSGRSHNGATSTTSNTIKLAPGIGGLTFANSITYNKLKQQSSLKSPQGSPITSNGAIVLKRDRDSSPLHNMATLTANGAKLVTRNAVHNTNSFTPKSIASAHSPVMQSNSAASPATTSTAQSTPVTTSLSSPAMISTPHNVQPYTTILTPISGNGIASVRNASSSMRSSPLSHTSIVLKPGQQQQQQLQLQRSKASPLTETEYPKPAYSYSCLIAIALKNSRSGCLPVSEIYSFMCEHFPYFKTAPSGWKNSVRHNLSLNRCFEKIEKPATNGNQRKGCLWAMKVDRITKMDEEVLKWSRKDPLAIRNAMVFPENLEALERGEMKHGSSADSDVDADSQSEIEEASDLEEQELDDTIVENMFVEEDVEDELEEEDEEDDLLNGEGAMSDDSLMMLNAADSSHGNSNDTDDGGRVVHRLHHLHRLQPHQQQQQQKRQQLNRHQQQIRQQQNRDFDIEVEDIYDAIDLEDDKEVVRRPSNGQHCLSSPSSTSSSSDIIELSPGDLNMQQHGNEGYQSPKRARLNINYSIGPAGELEKHVRQQQQQQQQQQLQQQHFNNHQLKPLQAQVIQRQAIKQVKLQQQQSTRTQHIVVQTISAGASSNGSPHLQATNNVVATQSIPQFQQITAISGNNNRRKVQLVNRIA